MIVPSLSFIATANVVRYVGAQPVFADVDASTQNLTPGYRRTASDRPYPCRYPGRPGGRTCGPGRDAGSVRAARDYCHRGRGVRSRIYYRDRPVGAGADLAAFSFHPRKLLTTGEGGMLVTAPDADVAARLRRLREHGMDVSAADRHRSRQPIVEHYIEVGFNYRMTDVQAAIGLVQLGKLEQMVTKRRTLAERYRRLLSTIPGLRMIGDPSYGTTNYQSFWILLPDESPVSRDEMLHILAQAGISARRGIMAAHLEPAYAGHPHGMLPVTERLTTNSLILPLFHDMTEAQQDSVASAVRTALDGSGLASRVTLSVP